VLFCLITTIIYSCHQISFIILCSWCYTSTYLSYKHSSTSIYYVQKYTTNLIKRSIDVHDITTSVDICFQFQTHNIVIIIKKKKKIIFKWLMLYFLITSERRLITLTSILSIEIFFFSSSKKSLLATNNDQRSA